MLSNAEGLSYQGFDIDSISDITGISMNKMDFVEQGSLHSGSFGSDNTDALLNTSFKDLEADESLLESISQVGVSEVPHKSPKERITSHGENWQENFKASNGDEGFFIHAGTHDKYAYPGTSKVSYVHKRTLDTFLTGQNKDGNDFCGIQDRSAIEHVKSFEQNKNSGHSVNFEENLESLIYKENFLPREFASDSEISLGGRESVIKHHSSLPVVNPESEATKFDQKQSHHVGSTDQYLANSCQDTISRTDSKLQIKPMNENGPVQQGQSGLLGDSSLYIRDIIDHHGMVKEDLIHDGQNVSRHTQGNVANFHGTEGTRRDVNIKSKGEYDRYFSTNVEEFHGGHWETELISGIARGVGNRDGYYESSESDIRTRKDMTRDHLKNSSDEKGQVDEMLLGVKHDPETNELYDDKVREGADLLSRLLGGDHNTSFTSHSSRSSERNTKASSLKPIASVNKQKSLDSSVHSEPVHVRLPSSSSPKNSISRNSDQTGLHVKSGPSRVDHTPLRHHRSLDSLNTETRFLDNVSPKRHDQRSIADSKAFVGVIEGMDANARTQNGHGNQLGAFISHSPKGISSSAEELRMKSNSLVQDNGQREHSYIENGNHPSKLENTRDGGLNSVRNEAVDLKRLELDIEEILSRKKMAAHELQILEESLQRNQADMKSSESLVEQYRLQATRARSELMDLEKRCAELQEECINLDGALKKSKQKETFNSDEVVFGRSKDEIFKALQEREQFKQDLDSVQEKLKREQKKAKTAQGDLREQIGNLERELSKQREENVKNLHIMKEERKSQMEMLEEKTIRETHQWKRAAENADLRIRQLEESLLDRNEELDKVRKHLREEKQKILNVEAQWRAQLESERQDADVKYDGQERSWKDREDKLLRAQKELENLVEERTADFRRSEDRCRAQIEEMQKVIENKNEEIKMLRGLVRQQEDATRVLGERLRNEAREHVRNAVEKERQCLDKEKERIKRVVVEEKEKHDRSVKQMTEQLDIEKERHSQTKETLNKLKQEGDDLRKQLVEVHGERITSVQRARHESGEELEKIKDKLHEFTVQADKLEKTDQQTAKAIYEECRKIAEMVDMPLSYKTPTRFSDESLGDAKESPTKEALASLRQCNDGLRQHLSDMKKQMTKQSTQANHTNETSHNELAELRKRLIGKEEEIQRLQRKHNEEIEKLKDEKRKEQLSYRRTISKLEQEFQKLVATKASSTPYKTKRDVTSRTTTTASSNGGTHFQFPNVNPASRSVEKSSSADLLKHLQDRVKKLRAENENLKKSSDNESLARNTRNPESALLQSKGLTISQLRTPSKSHSSMSENIEQVSRIQKLLAGTTKDD